MGKNEQRKIKKGIYGQGLQRGVNFSSAMEVEPGMKGILAFVGRDKEKAAVHELTVLFEEFAEKIYGDALKSGDEIKNAENKEGDLSEQLDRELAELKAKSQNKNRQFYWRKTHIECIVFFQTHDPIQPTSFVHQLLTGLKEGKVKRTRFSLKLHPVEGSCRAYPDDIMNLSKELFQTNFHAEGITPKKWACECRIRFNDSLKRDSIIGQIGELVTARHPVDLSNPELTVVMDIFKNICCMSVVKEYKELKRYNLEKIFEDSVEIENAEDLDEKKRKAEENIEESDMGGKKNKP
ncbi:hypothetical protein DFS34DRAFT_649304 [Phlyctochytrium arcticum]|nr:hypothetical protein DFS34DRAFT_649304 [Phlyctochytrium arcticum]